jgi:hypothetical protein
MLRKLICSLCILFVLVGTIVAAEVKGTFVKYDGDKKVLTVKVGDKDVEYNVTADTKFISAKGKAAKDFDKAMSKIKGMPKLTLQTEKKDGKETVTEVKAEPKADK